MQNLNKPLFSGHYLEFHLPESPEWQLDPSPIFAQLRRIRYLCGTVATMSKIVLCHFRRM